MFFIKKDCDPKVPKESKIIDSFNEFLNDIKNNEEQFSSLLSKYKSSLRIIYNGGKKTLLQFITLIEVAHENEEYELLDKLSIRPGIIYNSDKSSIKEIPVFFIKFIRVRIWQWST